MSRPTPRLPVTTLLVLAALAGGCTHAHDARRSAARAELGRAYLVEGNTEGAIEVLVEATRLDRHNWEAWNNLGMAYMKKGRPDEAEDAFKKAIRLGKEHAEAHLDYGLFLYSQERVDEAIAEYKVALEDLTYRKPSFILNNLGYAYYSQGKYAEAQDTLLQALSRAPNLCQARYNLGLTQIKLGRPDEALDSFQVVRRVCPDDFPDASLQAGSLLLERADHEEGLAILREIIQKHPDTPLAGQAEKIIRDAGY